MVEDSGSEETPIPATATNAWVVSGADVPRRMVAITESQADVIAAAQQAVDAAQDRLNAILLGVLTGHDIREAQVVGLKDRHLEVIVSRNGKP